MTIDFRKKPTQLPPLEIHSSAEQFFNSRASQSSRISDGTDSNDLDQPPSPHLLSSGHNPPRQRPFCHSSALKYCTSLPLSEHLCILSCCITHSLASSFACVLSFYFMFYIGAYISFNLFYSDLTLCYFLLTPTPREIPGTPRTWRRKDSDSDMKIQHKLLL